MTVTKVDMITIKTGILIFSGINFLIEDIVIFDNVRTNITAIPIPSELNAVVETARVGHNPIIKTRTGLFFKIPLVKFLNMGALYIKTLKKSSEKSILK